MAAYVIVEIEVTDPVRYEQYKSAAAASVTAHGGRYIVRGGQAETLEGEWRPKRLVVLEFPSVEKARAWFACEQYQAARETRMASARAEMVLVEGVS
jgi:uncharacterized protein (DUF1330 family)